MWTVTPTTVPATPRCQQATRRCPPNVPRRRARVRGEARGTQPSWQRSDSAGGQRQNRDRCHLLGTPGGYRLTSEVVIMRQGETSQDGHESAAHTHDHAARAGHGVSGAGPATAVMHHGEPTG